jgi:hypothetical protein
MTADPPTPDSHAELISEPITPTPGTFDTADMGKGLPGLPAEFTWRDRKYRVGILLAKWKVSGPEVGRLGGEKYLRRHYFRIRTTDNSVMTLYCERHTKTRTNPKARWFLYTIERPAPPNPS